MNDGDRDLVFSEAVKAGKRIYYFDVKQSRNGEKYVSITESKKIAQGTADDPKFTFEKHKLFLYREDYEKFANALAKVLEIAKEGQEPRENFSHHEASEGEETVQVAEKPQEEEAVSESLSSETATALDDLINKF